MKPGSLFRAFFVIVIALALALPPAGRAQAATLVVSNSNDSGPGSLRQAILNAVAGDTITFSGDFTIILASELAVNKPITITGAGHHVTISGNHVTRVFFIPQDGFSGSPTFDHLTIADGNHTINECSGSGVSCGSGMALDYLTGAIITNSTFTGNTSSLQGGAIYAYYGNLTITNTTFANNSTLAYGGAISCFYCNMALTNNTFYGNTTGGYGSALLNTWGNVTLRNNLFVKGANTVNLCDSDFADGGSTVDGGGNVRWGDTSCPGTTADPLLGTLGDYGGDVLTLPLLPGSGALGLAGANCPATDARGVARIAPCNPGAYEGGGVRLVKTGGDNQSTLPNRSFANPLVVNVTPEHAGDPVDGGVVTLTGPSSMASITPAISQATISGGAATWNVTANRYYGGPYTVTASTTGASPVTFSLTNICPNSITVTTNANSGAGSLRYALMDICPLGTITFAPDLAGQTITLTGDPVKIERAVTIAGPQGSSGVTISGNGVSRVFDISGSAVTLSNLTIRDGVDSPYMDNGMGGAGVLITGSDTTVIINNCTLTGNSAYGAGAAVAVGPGANLTLNNTTISANNSAYEAGGIYSMGTLTINSSTIANNTSPYYAGGVVIPEGSAVMRNSILAGNSGTGGAAADCYSPGYVFIQSAGGNLIGTTANCKFNSTDTDITNLDFASLKLGPLQNNGGPTPTHALLPGSPAIEWISGCNEGPAADQRGIPRPQGSACDAGAVEVVDNDSPDTTIESVTSGPYLPGGSITFTFSGSDAASGVRSFSCSLDSGSFSPCASPVKYAGLLLGPHTFLVRASDLHGHVDETPASFTWTIQYSSYLPLLGW